MIGVSLGDIDNLDKRGLDKRAGADKKADLAGCAWNHVVEFPEYPGGKLVLDNEAAILASGSISPLKDIVTWVMTERDAYCVPTLKGLVNAATFKNPGRGGNFRPSIDHVFEKSWLTDFFNEIVDSKSTTNVRDLASGPIQDKITCQDLLDFSNDAAGPNRLQAIFDTYPSGKKNPKNQIQVKRAKFMDDFIGMDQWTNGDAKGFVGTPNQVNIELSSKIMSTIAVQINTPANLVKKWLQDGRLMMLERLALGVEMMNRPESIAAMKRQNERIYLTL